MPSRPNPYYTSPDVYGSRGLGPVGHIGSAGSSTALPLAQLASTLADAITYDPKSDPRVIQARANNLKIANDQDRNTALAQERTMFNDPTIPLGDIASHAIGFGHMKPEEAGQLALLANAARGPQDGESMDDALSRSGLYELAAGKAGGSTFNASTYGERMKPTAIRDGSGQTTLVRAQDSYGQTPVLSKEQVTGNMLGDLAAAGLSRPEQLAATGAEPKERTPFNYTGPNGSGSTTDPNSVAGPGVTVFNAAVNATNPEGLTTGVKTNVQEAQLQLQHFQDLLKMARGIASKDPTLFGITGEARRGVQEIGQQLGNLRLMTGSKGNDLDGIYKDTLAKMVASGFTVPGADQGYDPNLSDIRKLSVLLRYAGASALASQTGRSVSDADVKTFQNVVGDPGNWLSTQPQYLSGLDIMDRVAAQMSARNASALNPKATPVAPPPPAGAPAKAPQDMTDDELRAYVASKRP